MLQGARQGRRDGGTPRHGGLWGGMNAEVVLCVKEKSQQPGCGEFTVHLYLVWRGSRGGHAAFLWVVLASFWAISSFL